MERRQRYRLAAGSYIAAVAYAATILLADAPQFLLVGLVVPLSLGTEWLLQARRSFCAGLALSGRFKFEGRLGRVPDGPARESDQRYSLRLFLVGLGTGVVTTSVVYVGVQLLA